VTHWKRAVVERDTYDTLWSIIYVTGIATTICGRADLGTTGVNRRIINRTGIRSILLGRCDVGNLSSLDRVVERIYPSLRHCSRIRNPWRVCGCPGSGPYLCEAGRSRSLTPKERVNGVVVLMIPSARKSALGDVIVAIVVTRDGGAVYGGGEREEEEECSSNGGEHCAGREGARRGA